MFTRSLAPLKRQGVRVNVLCPEVLLKCLDATTYFVMYYLLTSICSNSVHVLFCFNFEPCSNC
jgi:NAD(P)-dependent dehydrogenase (short-subunit alcohol dehydrogenase family)